MSGGGLDPAHTSLGVATMLFPTQNPVSESEGSDLHHGNCQNLQIKGPLFESQLLNRYLNTTNYLLVMTD